jgi:hypothetical protein
VSFERVRRELGFQCHTSLEMGVRGLQEALRRGLVKDYREPIYNNYQTLLSHVRQPATQLSPEAELMAPRFSKKSLWWHINQTNSRNGAANGHSNNGAANGHSSAAASKPASRVAAAGS